MSKEISNQNILHLEALVTPSIDQILDKAMERMRGRLREWNGRISYGVPPIKSTVITI